jgi:hypothetical protein
MQQCPTCQSDDIQRSRSRSWWEQWRKEITNKRTYRCHACGWRGWGFDTGPRCSPADPHAASGQLGSDPPNLKDSAFPGVNGRRRPLSLSALDIIEPNSLNVGPAPGKAR